MPIKLPESERTLVNLVDSSVKSFRNSLKKKAKIFQAFLEEARKTVVLRRVPLEAYDEAKRMIHVGSVDGSNNERESLGISIGITTAVGVVMHGLHDTTPALERVGFPREFVLSEIASAADIAGIQRDISEAKMTLKVLDKMVAEDWRPGLIMLDGPILPHDSLIRGIGRSVGRRHNIEGYLELFLEYVGKRGKPGLVPEVFAKAREADVPLVGIVKRPRSVEYVGSLLGHDYCKLTGMHDALILNPLLDEIQADGEFYATELLPTRQERILSYFDDIKHGDILYTYVVPARGAPPIRVEIPRWVDEAGRVGEILALVIQSARHSHVGIPLPILLAHMQCKIPDKLREVLWREIEFRAAEFGDLGLQLIKTYKGRSP